MNKIDARSMADFRAMCAAFGRRGKGKRKTMTRAAIDQRQQAAKQSAISRGKRVKRKPLRVKGKSFVKGNTLPVKGNYLVKGNSTSPAPGFKPPTPPNPPSH
jgi:Ni/Co efflux regulator RcnB